MIQWLIKNRFEEVMRALLFDFDGVLVRSMEDHYRGWKQALLEYGIEMIPEELFMLEGQGVGAIASQLTRKYNLPSDRTPSIIEKKQEVYNKIKKVEFYPNLLDVLNWAQEKELKIAIVTGGQRQRVLEALDDFGLTPYFQTIVTAEDVSETKPSPQPYLLAARSLDCKPEQCVVIENAPLGVRAGKAAGMHVVAITSTLSPQYLKEADVVVNDMVELQDVLKRIY